MFWYIIIYILMMYPLVLVVAGNKNRKDTQYIALVISCVILWFFMAMRSVSVGVDTKYYSYVFTQFSDIPWSKIFSEVTYANESKTWAFDFEPGYRLLNKIISVFSDSPQAITIVNSTIIFILLYILIRRNSPNYWLSIWLYFSLGIYQTEMNVTRNAIAILIVYNLFQYIPRKQWGRYCIGCIIAASIHIAVLLFIPLYWLIQNVKLTKKRIVILMTISMGVGLLFPAVSPYIVKVLPYRFGKYFIGTNAELSSLLVGVFNVILFVLCYVQMREREHKKLFKENQVGLWIFLLNMCFFGLNIGLEDASRMAALFGPYMIIFIPQIVSEIESKVRKKNVVVLVAVLSGIQYLMRLLINNIGGTMPYQFFW